MENLLTGYITGFRGTAEALLSRITELESRDYPTALSKKLLRVLRSSIQESQVLVEDLVTQNDPDIENTVMRHGEMLQWFHQFIHTVGSSLGSDVPRWAIEPMKYEISKYLTNEVDILIVGSQVGGNFAYDYRLDRLKGLLSSAFGPDRGAELAAELPAHMPVFHFPFGERDNVFAHGAFFHEVGHQIDMAILSLSRRVCQEFLTEKDAAIRDAVRNASGDLVVRMFGNPENEEEAKVVAQQADIFREQLVKAVQTVMWHWSREFCADLIATRILGPAYAMVVVISPALLNALDIHAQTHPSTLLRLRVILDLLSDDSAGNYFSECDEALKKAGIRDLLHEWKNRCGKESATTHKWSDGASIHPLANDELKSATVELAQDLSCRILNAVVNETDQLGYYTPVRYNDDIEHVLPTLEGWITINERIDFKNRTHRANEVATIFNVGVACYLSQTTEQGRERLSKLLRKSIELSQIQLRREQAQAQLPEVDG